MATTSTSSAPPTADERQLSLYWSFCFSILLLGHRAKSAHNENSAGRHICRSLAPPRAAYSLPVIQQPPSTFVPW